MSSVRRSLPRALRDLLAPRKRVGDPSQTQVNAATGPAAIELILVDYGLTSFGRRDAVNRRLFLKSMWQLLTRPRTDQLGLGMTLEASAMADIKA